MVRGWRPVVVSVELYQVIRDYYDENKEELKLRHGIRSLSAYVSFCLREYLKEKGII